MADFVNRRQFAIDWAYCDPAGIVFGRSMTQLSFDFARTLAKDWGSGDQVVVTRLDHDANIRPWVIAALIVRVSSPYAPDSSWPAQAGRP